VVQFAILVALVLALSTGFLVLERLLPAEKGQPFRSWLFNVAYAPFILAIIFMLGPVLTVSSRFVAEWTGGGLLPAFGAAGSSVPAQIGFALSYAIGFDLWQYAMHRLQHRSKWLWETHRFHHDDTALNASTQTRVHPTSYLLSVVFHLPVVLLFGLRAPHAIAVFLMFTLWGFINHTNLRVGLGPLTPVIAGPQWHRIHHSVLKEHRDKNFAVLFPFIDMLFGTYYRPRPGEYPPTGVGGTQLRPIEAATVAPFRAWRRMLPDRSRGRADAGAVIQPAGGGD
jgi:sterol desaturase/sphingolipid hydroxylase (fatty acid hydroxylase superfamily)